MKKTFKTIGNEADYQAYADILKEHIRKDTVCININGNHEMKSDNHNELFKHSYRKSRKCISLLFRADSNALYCIS